MNQVKTDIFLPDGRVVAAQAPVIVTASRATDIPAFYGEWLTERVREGYVKWRNPFNGVPLYVSFRNTRLFVFWTKDPAPFMQFLPFFDAHYPTYYFQFTLNDYTAEGFEPGLPPVEERIDTFIRLSERLGPERVVWRFDPLVLTRKIGVDELLRKVEFVGDRLNMYTRKLVFSFADIGRYRKVRSNLQKRGVEYREFDEETMHVFAAGLQELNGRWGLELATCAEAVDLSGYRIMHNRCVDGELISRLFPGDEVLMDFVKGQSGRTDKGQRPLCGCLASKDIGMYDSCPHGCVYCYANRSPEGGVIMRF